MKVYTSQDLRILENTLRSSRHGNFEPDKQWPVEAFYTGKKVVHSMPLFGRELTLFLMR